MTTLVLGGSKGKTSSRLASLLSENNIPFVLASRSVSNSCPYPQIHFDWLDEKTYGEPFKHGEISAVYIVAPPVTDMFPPMKAFIDFAFKEKRVRRFVLLSASSLERGGPMMGQAHDYLLKLATEHEGLEYAVLRPTWFMAHDQNNGKIYSATQNGKIPFVSVDDIAAVASRALVDEKSHDMEHVILGQELLSYDDGWGYILWSFPVFNCNLLTCLFVKVAAILSDVLGRKITHVNLSEEQLAAGIVANGIPEDYAAILAAMDTAIAHGAENRLNNTVKKVTGRTPRKFRDFAIEKKQAWL